MISMKEVRDWLERTGTSQNALAAMVNLSPATIGRMLNGETKPRRNTLLVIEAVINDTASEGKDPLISALSSDCRGMAVTLDSNLPDSLKIVRFAAFIKGYADGLDTYIAGPKKGKK